MDSSQSTFNSDDLLLTWGRVGSVPFCQHLHRLLQAASACRLPTLQQEPNNCGWNGTLKRELMTSSRHSLTADRTASKPWGSLSKRGSGA
eukprot:4913041-Amphidinium_carterae.1